MISEEANDVHLADAIKSIEPSYLHKDDSIASPDLLPISKIFSRLTKSPKRKGVSKLKYRVPSHLLKPNKKDSAILLKQIDKNKPETIWNFITANMCFISFIIHKRFHRLNDEMMSDGVWGLHRAINYYQKKYSHNEFLSYADKCICQQVREGLALKGTPLSPSRKYIANKTVCCSLDRKLPTSRIEEGVNKTLADLVTDPLELSPVEKITLNENQELCKKILEICRQHSYFKKENTVIESFLEEVLKETNSPMTVTANKLGYTYQNVNLIIHKFIKYFNKHMAIKHKLLQFEMENLLGQKRRNICVEVRKRKKIRA